MQIQTTSHSHLCTRPTRPQSHRVPRHRQLFRSRSQLGPRCPWDPPPAPTRAQHNPRRGRERCHAPRSSSLPRPPPRPGKPPRVCRSRDWGSLLRDHSASSSLGNAAATLVSQTLSPCSAVSEPRELQKRQADKIHFPSRQLPLIFGFIT